MEMVRRKGIHIVIWKANNLALHHRLCIHKIVISIVCTVRTCMCVYTQFWVISGKWVHYQQKLFDTHPMATVLTI